MCTFRDIILDLQHTEVPVDLRGRGIASLLVRRVLDDVRSRGEKIIATCPFVKAFLAKNPAYRALVAPA